jgi:electron transport complex protein RnfC
MEKAFQDTDGDVAVTVLRTSYPQGSEKQQIFSVTDAKCRAAAADGVGCVVENVSHAFAVFDAVVNGRPLVRRVITVTGDAIAQPANLLAPAARCTAIGGGVRRRCRPGGQSDLGRPMMGFRSQSLAVPTGKTASACAAFAKKNL